MPFEYLLLESGGFMVLEEGGGDLIIDRSNFLLQDPRHCTFEQWAATVLADNRIGPLPIDERSWKAWADRVRQVTVNAPDTAGFTDWREWAFAWLASS